MDNIIFIGMPASGKSTIGVVTAKRLGYGFIDPDILIQEQEGRLLHQQFYGLRARNGRLSGSYRLSCRKCVGEIIKRRDGE